MKNFTQVRELIWLTLELFNVVPTITIGEELPVEKKLSKKALKLGLFLMPQAMHLRHYILEYYTDNRLTAKELNNTFHKSWSVIQNSTRFELLIHQILHYMTTYGTNFQSEYIYIPEEKLEIPKSKKRLPIKVIHAISKDELIEKCLNLLESGVALKEETVDKLLRVLEILEYRFTTVDNIKNKEALIKVIAKTGVYPTHSSEFFRYLFYLATRTTLVIKNKEAIAAIVKEAVNISAHCRNYGYEKCAETFNRFKPLWLAFKKATPNNIPTVNKISKLSKKYHKPMPLDILNHITSLQFPKADVKEALAKVNNFRKVRLLYALRTRIEKPEYLLYKVRNGKAYVKESNLRKGQKKYYKKVHKWVYNSLVEGIKDKVKGKVILYPDNVDYGVPATEKAFIGNIPYGTVVENDRLAVGINWENEEVLDLDISTQSVNGKIGWNSEYRAGGLMFSGDVVRCPGRATELFHAKDGISAPAVLLNNIYTGSVSECDFKVIAGKPAGISQNYMFKPNELLFEFDVHQTEKQQILGIFIPEEDTTKFVFTNMGFGKLRVSRGNNNIDRARTALVHQFRNPVTMRELLSNAGAIVYNQACIEEDGLDPDIDLSTNNLAKDSILNLLI